ncbi:stalk domain-containing protein [Paenibacillus thermotolerans]|uniref:stalk domain-containing protein n=1 Tax=Paenibacillus thermotolerans TaxID=3027807 RepID=UPI00236877C7|nr:MULTISPECIES: stalk domain-containing protein [unclassified Paenibacillus]
MKTRFMFVLVLLLAIGTALPVSAHSEAEAAVKSSLALYVDGKKIDAGLPMYTVNNSLTVPIRVVSGRLGATVAWDQRSQTVTLKKDGNTIVLPVGSHTAKVNGADLDLPAAAYVKNGTTYVPIRFVSELFGLNVNYDQKQKTVKLAKQTEPSVMVAGVAEGAVYTADKVTVSVVAVNHELADFRKVTEPKKGQGHIHIWLDQDVSDAKIATKVVSGDPVSFDVKPGKHTLTVQLVGNDHKPVMPEVKRVIRFETKASGGGQATSVKPAVHEVTISDYAFAPETLTVKKGDTVKFTNRDDVKHTATSDGHFDSGLLADGDSFEVTLKEAGEYDIYCKPHPMMKMKIIVE